VDLRDYTPQPHLARAATLPGRWYVDPAFLTAERARVFGRTWQMVGLGRCVCEPGQYFPCEIAGEPAVVARGKDGVLRAFSNVCRHRAAIVVEKRDKGAALLCP
jgi:choline monooxygenase